MTSLIKIMLDEIELIDTGKVLDHKMKADMALSLTRFTRDAIEKFIQGQREHGHIGRLEERDLDKETYKEIIDLFFYNQAKTWKK